MVGASAIMVINSARQNGETAGLVLLALLIIAAVAAVIIAARWFWWREYRNRKERK